MLFRSFPELTPALYFNTIYVDDGVTVVPQHWVRRLAGSGLLNLLRMPHFRHYNVTNQLARQFLALVHNGFLWIRDRVPIDAALVHRITGLPMNGPHPLERVGKKYEGDTTEYVRKTYHVEINTQGFIIKSINDPATHMGTILLAFNLMRKF